MTDRVLKIFLLEDRPAEAELTKRMALKYAPNALFTIANSEEEFLERITWNDYDLMLSDYHIPGYNGLEALLYLREHYPEMPLIFVTGTLNNEMKAADAILQGANGFVLKDNLEVLPQAMELALSEAEVRRQKAQERLQKQRKRNIQLQKIKVILQHSEAFSEKEELTDLLAEVMEV